MPHLTWPAEYLREWEALSRPRLEPYWANTQITQPCLGVTVEPPLATDNPARRAIEDYARTVGRDLRVRLIPRYVDGTPHYSISIIDRAGMDIIREDTVDQDAIVALLEGWSLAEEGRLAELREREWLANAQRAAAAAERERVSAVARGLLVEHLAPEQRIMLDADDQFVAVGGRTGDHYLVTKGHAGNVFKLRDPSVKLTKEMDWQRFSTSYCIVMNTNEPVPVYDSMLAQKLVIERNEDYFLETAIATNYS